MARYFGVPLRNGLPIGLGSTIAINRAVRQALPPPSGDALLQEDGTSYFELQDGTGYILLEGLMPTLWLDFQNSTSLDSRITFSRGSQATLFDSTGTLVYAANNTVRNNMMVGAVAGSPGTLPTNWIASVGGLAYSVVGTGVENGITYIDLRFQGTPTSTGPQTLTPDIFSAFVGQTFTASGYFKLAAGTTTNINTSNFQLRIADEAAFTLVPLTSTLTRISNTRTLTGTNAGWRIRWNYVDTVTPVDFTLRIGMPQLEIGSTMGAVIATSGTAYYAPRFDYNPSTLQPRGLLIEEQRTNSIRNNTMQGAVAGTPGVFPTNWSASLSGSGITQEISAVGTESGIAYVDVRYYGTPSAGSNVAIGFEAANSVAALSGQTWTESVYVKLQAGAFTNTTTTLSLLGTNGTSGTESFASATITSTPSDLRNCRLSVTGTLANAGTTHVQPRIRIGYTVGVAFDITLRIGLPQLEQGAFATSVIPTTTTALTRNADVASMTGTNFSSWYSASEGTLFAQVTAAQNASTAYVTLSNGNQTQNSIYFDNDSGNMRNVVFSSSSAVAVLNLGSIGTVGAVSRLAAAYQVNNFAAVRNGGTVQTDTLGAVPASVSQMNIGASTAGAAASYINGYIQRIAYYPTRLPNATLQALTA